MRRSDIRTARLARNRKRVVDRLQTRHGARVALLAPPTRRLRLLLEPIRKDIFSYVLVIINEFYLYTIVIVQCSTIYVRIFSNVRSYRGTWDAMLAVRPDM